MSRWIEVNEFYDKMYEWVRINGGIIRNEMQAILEATPSIDIVRCKECKYWEESQYYQGFMVCTYVKGATFARQHDDFCSRGERKESE